MYDKITDRVKKLIALACSTHSPEEARTAAKMAVDLIAQHGLLDRPQASAPPPPPPRQPPPAAWHGPIDCKPTWKGVCEVCRGKLHGRVYWLDKRVRHSKCHAAMGSK